MIWFLVDLHHTFNILSLSLPFIYQPGAALCDDAIHLLYSTVRLTQDMYLVLCMVRPYPLEDEYALRSHHFFV